MNDSKANTHISHYRIISEIGAGGMGEVYQAVTSDSIATTRSKRMQLETELARKENREIPLVDRATIQLGLGNEDAALTSLERLVANRREHVELVQIKVEPRWDPIRDDPRFKELVRKIGFP